MLISLSYAQIAMPYAVVGTYNQTDFGVNATLTFTPP
jgi:hypothetical protein